MVCVNQEELGAHIDRVASPRLDIDADVFSLEFTQIFALRECPECQNFLFFWPFLHPHRNKSWFVGTRRSWQLIFAGWLAPDSILMLI